MEFSVTSKVEDGKIICQIHAPEANRSTRYAYYLFDSDGRIIERQGYISKNEVAFVPAKSGVYSVKGFVKVMILTDDGMVSHKETKESNLVQYSVDAHPKDRTKGTLPYPVKQLRIEDLDVEDFKPIEPTAYEIIWDNVKYEFLINFVPESGKAVVLGTGSVRTAKRLPMFSRATWMDELPCTGIWYFDPTVYLSEELNLAWGYGVNERWYLKDIALILEKILDKHATPMNNVLFFGSSGGGFTSIMLATMLRGKATVINPQWNIENYTETFVNRLKQDVLKENETLIPERVDVIVGFLAEKYFPAIHLIQNVLAQKDIERQLVPFLNKCRIEKLVLDNLLRIDFYTNLAGHVGMPSKEETLRFICEDLNWSLPNPRSDIFSY